MEHISRSKFAKKLGCSRTYIQQLIAEGAIPTGAVSEHGINPLIALEGIHRLVGERSKIYAPAEAWRTELHVDTDPAKRDKAMESASQSNGVESIAEAKLRKAIAEANIKEIAVAEKRKTLVNAKEVEQQAFAMARQLRDAILAIPDRVTPIIATEMDEHAVRQILDKEFRNVLRGLAEGAVG